MGKRHFLTLLLVSMSQFLSVSVLSKPASLVVHTDTEPDYLYYLGDRSNSPTLTAQANKLVLDLLPFSIHYELVPLKRTMKMMASGEKVCALDKLVTEERKLDYLFSSEVSVFLSRQLYQRSEIAKLTENEVDLVALFDNHKHQKLLLTSQVNYGETLESQIARISNGQKVYRSGGEQALAMVEMFAKGRAEYALFYPQQLKELDVNLAARSYQVKGIPPYVTGHIMCTKGDNNSGYLKQIDAHLSRLYRSDELLKVHLSHVDSANVSRIKLYFEQLQKRDVNR